MASLLSLFIVLFVGTESDQDHAPPQFGPAVVTVGETVTPPASLSVCGFSLVAASEDGPQVAITARPSTMLAVVRHGEVIQVDVAVTQLSGPFEISSDVRLVGGERAEVSLALGPGQELCWRGRSGCGLLARQILAA